nr:RNA pseudouridine synthase [Prevotella sp.]
MKHYYNNTPQDYTYIQVEYEAPLLDYLLKNVKMSHNKIKDTLQGRGIKVGGKTVTQFDYPLKRGMKLAISKSK